MEGAKVLTGTVSKLSAKEEDIGAFDVTLSSYVSCVTIGLAEDSADDVFGTSDEQETASVVTSMIDKRQNNNLHFMRY